MHKFKLTLTCELVEMRKKPGVAERRLEFVRQDAKTLSSRRQLNLNPGLQAAQARTACFSKNKAVMRLATS